MVRIESRLELFKLLPNHCIGIELGVATGYFSEILLQSKRFQKLFRSIGGLITMVLKNILVLQTNFPVMAQPVLF